MTMNIANFDGLVRAARAQPEPQRLLFVFANAEMPEDGTPEQRSEAPGWGIPLAFGALMLIAGALIFSAAGPDRTRTAEYNNLNSKPSASAPSTDMRGPAAKVPNPDMPTAPRSQ